MFSKKILVTGGSGFIGSNLVKQLVKEGCIVTVLDNFSTGFYRNLEQVCPIKMIEGDIRDKVVVERAMQDVDIVFHLAASVGNKRSIDNPIKDAEINVIGTLQIIQSAIENKIHKLVVSSSAGIFGELKELPIKEDHPIEPDSPYGCTKLCEEKLCLSLGRLYNIEVICLRYFNVYGPNQQYDHYGNVIPIFVYKILHDQPITIFGNGEQTRDFVYVDDVVQANIKAAKCIGFSGALNIASGTSVKINQLVEIIKEKSGSPVKIEYGKERPGDVLHSIADITEASRRIGYSPRINLEDGIEHYINWARGKLI